MLGRILMHIMINYVILVLSFAVGEYLNENARIKI